MALGQFSLREVVARPLRAVLTVASIAIGVGAVVAVLLSIGTTRQAQRDMLRAVSGKADLEIVSDAASGMPYTLLNEIRATPGVEVAIPSLQRFAKLFHATGMHAPKSSASIPALINLSANTRSAKALN